MSDPRKTETPKSTCTKCKQSGLYFIGEFCLVCVNLAKEEAKSELFEILDGMPLEHRIRRLELKFFNLSRKKKIINKPTDI